MQRKLYFKNSGGEYIKKYKVLQPLGLVLDRKGQREKKKKNCSKCSKAGKILISCKINGDLLTHTEKPHDDALCDTTRIFNSISFESL